MRQQITVENAPRMIKADGITYPSSCVVSPSKPVSVSVGSAVGDGVARTCARSASQLARSPRSSSADCCDGDKDGEAVGGSVCAHREGGDRERDSTTFPGVSFPGHSYRRSGRGTSLVRELGMG